MLMTLTGALLIGDQRITRANGFRARNARSGATLDGQFTNAIAQDVDQACQLADAAFDSYRATSPEMRAKFLDAIADEIEALGDALIVRACAESGLPEARIRGERGRTMGQLRMFASLLRDGSCFDARIDTALPDRKPLPRADLRQIRIGVGPVAVFGASNFPLAFSVAGGDTASALAAGCPVVARAHSAHPGTSELIGNAIILARQHCGLHEGVFSLIGGEGHEIGASLVQHPAIQAVGFTGSRQGGLALSRLAAARLVPIPVYAEMSSINPVYLLGGALREKAEALAEGFVASLTMGAGQFCTNPGLVLALAGPDLERFVERARGAIAKAVSATMLTQGIRHAYDEGVEMLASRPGAVIVAQGPLDHEAGCRAALFRSDAQAFVADRVMSHEIFGACSLIIACDTIDTMLDVTRSLEGQLTATLQMTAEDLPVARHLLPILERKVGRILANSWPTGVEVSAAMVHGGPFPATSDPRSTSVGTGAIERFLRPVCYQDIPDELLPDGLQDANPLALPRRVDPAM
ncbi:2,5-dioxovalerate dehydrogenase [Asaia siamensis]|uniref:2,5-dioxovalerate dehydrogenase n=2 Tax=Asaia siamensis TaxID=110479 RepID=A0ABQ1M0W9_9PROT|nr:NAD-dependent aldehyde dehydrogenase [Asaia siamensis NRIC 0323]GGC32886.1 2,5-dioxovalerate dehydrogenase [Asaia siamensis]